MAQADGQAAGRGVPPRTVWPAAAVEAAGQFAYLWGWPMVNLRNRWQLFSRIPRAGLIDGVVPAAPVGRLCMLHDYIDPAERHVACPNQDCLYGISIITPGEVPVVMQVPDFGGRFWVYQVGDQRTDGFAEIGAMYHTTPGHYLIVGPGWDGEVPDGITGVLTCPTRIGYVLPRIFMDDTHADRAAVQHVINQIDVYPLDEYDGSMKHHDWSAVTAFPAQPGAAAPAAGDEATETQWVAPGKFFAELPEVLQEVPARAGEEAVYATMAGLAEAAQNSADVAAQLTDLAARCERELITPLFEFRNDGIPVGHGWHTIRNGAGFGFDYLTRTACAKAMIFNNRPVESTYFFTDTDADGHRLTGGNSYWLTFPAAHLPPVRGFWSLTLYGRTHFFHDNELRRFSVGTKNKDLVTDADGSLTLIASAEAPPDRDLLPNWLPAPAGEFSLFIRTYWPGQPILDGTWKPGPVREM